MLITIKVNKMFFYLITKLDAYMFQIKILWSILRINKTSTIRILLLNVTFLMFEEKKLFASCNFRAK